MRQHLILVPGFFGFVNFGRLAYFAHVRELLEQRLGERGVEVEIHRVRTHPVASLRRRSLDLLEYLAGLPRGEAVHVVGHSTGGLDARMALSPRVELGRDDVESIVRDVRSATSICTPHWGSPVASHFAGAIGEPLLRTLSMLTVLTLRQGRVPARLALRTARALVAERLLPNTPVNLVLEALENDAASALRAMADDDPAGISIAEFMKEVRATPTLITQLMPPALDVFNTGIRDRPGVSYNCVVARSPAPDLRTQLTLSGGPYEHATHAWYQWLHRRSTAGVDRVVVSFDEQQTAAFVDAWGSVPSATDSDGLVPTRSQVHGRVVHTTPGDHLDVIGHFADPAHEPPHYDLLSSGAPFGRPQFERLWTDVLDAILQA